jgi:phosphohistidine phosphatase SixA
VNLNRIEASSSGEDAQRQLAEDGCRSQEQAALDRANRCQPIVRDLTATDRRGIETTFTFDLEHRLKE